jgi:SAM-dependent methyltransferase
MSTVERARRREGYALGYSPEEYERLRAQARMWEPATARLLDRLGVKDGARCLDAGCGPGETMRLLAERTGPSGRVVGLDADSALGERAVTDLHAAGHAGCRFVAADLTDPGPLPGGPYDLVYARLLLYHLPERVAVLARLWDAVAPGGHLLVQDYDVRCVGVEPPLASIEEARRVMLAAFTARGCDVHVGSNLATLFADAGIGAPDGTDVTGHVEPLAAGHGFLAQVYRSLLPVSLAHGITTEAEAESTLAALGEDAARHADRPMLWPLLIGAWKEKPQA